MLTLTLVLCLSESSKPVIGLPRLIITLNSPPPLFMAFYGGRLPYRELWFRWSPIYFLILLLFTFFYGGRLPYREYWFRWSPIYFLISLVFTFFYGQRLPYRYH